MIGNIHIFNPAASGDKTISALQGFYKSNDAGLRLTGVTGGGAGLPEAADAFRIIMGAGAIATGEFKLYGVDKAL